MVSRIFCGIIRSPRLPHLREEQLLLYGYYNSEQPLIQVKICTAVDKEKGNYGKARRKLKTCNKKLINAEIAVFFCRKLLMFGVECVIMIFNDTMY